jgi:hypothetical protein
LLIFHAVGDFYRRNKKKWSKALGTAVTKNAPKKTNQPQIGIPPPPPPKKKKKKEQQQQQQKKKENRSLNGSLLDFFFFFLPR